jgi:hypothetical protein
VLEGRYITSEKSARGIFEVILEREVMFEGGVDVSSLDLDTKNHLHCEHEAQKPSAFDIKRQ